MNKHMKELDSNISELPEPVIHHIMSFLPTIDAARISALSTKFRTAWLSFPIIRLDTGMYSRKPDTTTTAAGAFLDYVNLFITCRIPNISVDEFCFSVFVVKDIEKYFDRRLSRAFKYAIKSCVKELTISFKKAESYALPSKELYNLPSEVLSAKSITVLNLTGCKLRPQDLVLSYPVIEALSLKSCGGMKTLKVSCGKLKVVKIKNCGGLQKIEMEASNLECFSYSGVFSRNKLAFESCEINIAACKLMKYFRLKGTEITDEWIVRNVYEFCSLEVMKLDQCNRLENLFVSNGSVKTMALEDCSNLRSVKVVALNLDSFVCKECPELYTFDIGACESLGNLTLEGIRIADRCLERQVSELPSLNNLTLSRCNALKKFKISHAELKSFHLIGCDLLREAWVDVRSLESFVYEGKVESHIVIGSSSVKAKVRVQGLNSPVLQFPSLRNFLEAFGHCKELSIVCESETDWMVPDEFRYELLPPMYDLKHMSLHTTSKLQNANNLVESLLWLAPRLDVISIVSGSQQRYLKFHYDWPAIDGKDSSCCKSNSLMKCWRHYLKEVKMENFPADEKLVLQKFFSAEAANLEAIYD